MFKSRLARRILKTCAILALLAVLGIGALFGSLWLEHGTEVTLPTPTGPFAVGRAIYDWVDETTPDGLASSPGTKREVLVWIWYPSEAGPAATTDDYLPAPMRAAVERGRGPLLNFLARDLSKVHGHSLRDADLSRHEPAYPVVIFRGGASLEVWNYSTLAEDLASHGYVVVGIDAPYRTFVVTFPDGRVITRRPENNPEFYEGQPQSSGLIKLLTAWTDDISFAVDRLQQLNTADPSGKFTGRLDMTRVGVFGHSFGGAQAAQFCSEDPRCKAAIDLDGLLLGSVVQTGISRPFMFLLSDQDSSDAQGRQIMGDIQSVYNRLPPDGRSMIKIRGANHFTFSDDGALLKSRVFRGALRVFGKLGIDGRRQLAVTTYCVHTFFDAYLKGTGVSGLKISSPLYPEIDDLE